MNSNNNFKSCIYKISNNQNVNQCYIGSTATFKSRMSYHYHQCKINNPAKLYKAINENGGVLNWTFEILKSFTGMSKEDLRKEEEKYINLFNPPLNKNRAYVSKQERQEQSRIRSKKFRDNNSNYFKDYYKKKKLNSITITIDLNI